MNLLTKFELNELNMKVHRTKLQDIVEESVHPSGQILLHLAGKHF